MPEPTTEIPIARVASLTARELEIAQLVGRGLSNSEIAVALQLCESTVTSHLARRLDKLRARGRVAVVTRMWETGLMRLQVQPPIG